MGFQDANTLLSGPKQPIAKFDRVGDSITGVLVDAEVMPITNPQGEIQYDERSGAAKQQIVYTLQTTERDADIEEDDGKRRVFAKWAIQKAISECLAELGLGKIGLQEGGTLTITHSETKKSKTRGFNDTKLYTAEYVAPPARRLPNAPSDPTPAAADPGTGITSDELWHGETPAADTAHVPAASYPQASLDLAWSIHNSNPDTALSVISAATKIAVTDLENMFEAI